MNSEKVKEIKKALECCKRNEIEDTCEYCLDCPANNWDYETECNVELFQNSLTLINELESEIERLLEQRNKTYNIWVKDTEKLKDRIAELEMENKTKTDTITDLLKKQEFYEKEKLTKFAERLKEELKNHSPIDGYDFWKI